MAGVRNELKQALEQGNLYDFISNEGYRFDKSELIDIIKNLNYAVYSKYGTTACKEIEEATIEALNEYAFFDED